MQRSTAVLCTYGPATCCVPLSVPLPTQPNSCPPMARSRIPMPPLAQLGAVSLPPATQCYVINAWSAVVVGAAVPLATQAWWELARWRAYHQQRAAAALAAAGAGDLAAAASAAAEEEEGEAWHSLVPTGHCLPVEMLLFSSLVWCLATLGSTTALASGCAALALVALLISLSMSLGSL